MKSKKDGQVVRTALLLGLGAASITAEAVSDSVEKLRAQGNVSESEARAMVRQIIADSRRQKGRAIHLAHERLAAFEQKSPFALKADLARMDARLKRVEAALNKRAKR